MTINNISFGKTPVLKCNIKGDDGTSRTGATLYKLDVKDNGDVKDVEYSKNTYAIKNQFLNDHIKGKSYYDYYLLQKDGNNEVLGCMQTSTHYAQLSSQKSGKAIVIDEMSDNGKFTGTNEVMLSYLAHEAKDRLCDCIISSLPQDLVPYLSNAKFTRTVNGDDCLKDSKFSDVIQQGGRKHQINFEV